MLLRARDEARRSISAADGVSARGSTTVSILPVVTQEALWQARRAAEPRIIGAISAMPSLHVAAAVLFACDSGVEK